MLLYHNLRIILFLGIIIILISCTPKKPVPQNEITLTFCTFSGGENFKEEKKILDLFEQTHPHIKLKFLYTPWGSYTEKILVLTVGGIPPDVMWTIPGDLPFYASRNILMDITQLVANDHSLDTTKYFPHALEICSFQNKLYSLPRDVNCLFYVYNKDIFDKENLPYPSPSWTWEDLLNLSLKLTKDKNGDGHIDQYGIGGSGGNYFYWNDVAHSNGGAPLSPDGKLESFTQPEFYEAIQWWLDLAIKYHVAPTAAENQGFGGDLFQNQICAIAMTGIWNFTEYHENIKFPYDIVNIPRGKKGNKVSLLGLPIAISSKTKYPKEAYELLRFLTYDERAQSLQAKLAVAMPSRKDIATSDIFMGQEIMPAHIDLYMKSMLEYTYVGDRFTSTKLIYDHIQSAIDLAGLGKISTKDAMLLKKPLVDKVIRKAIEKGEL